MLSFFAPRYHARPLGRRYQQDVRLDPKVSFRHEVSEETAEALAFRGSCFLACHTLFERHAKRAADNRARNGVETGYEAEAHRWTDAGLASRRQLSAIAEPPNDGP